VESGSDGKLLGQAPLACAAAAVLADPAGSGISDDADIRSRLALLRNLRLHQWQGLGQSHPGDKSVQLWVIRIIDTTRDLLSRLDLPNVPISWTVENETDVGLLLAAAFPDRIARLQEPGRFRFVSGRESRIEGPLANAEWLVAAEADPGERLGVIRLAAPLSPEAALSFLKNQTTEEATIEWNGLIPKARVSRRAGRLLLSETKSPARREWVIQDLPRLLGEQGLAILPWEDEAGAPRRLLERIRFFAAHSPKIYDGIVDFWSDNKLLSDSGAWLAPGIWEENQKTEKGPVINGKGLIHALENRLGWDLCRELDKQVPQIFALPNGKKRPLDYSSGEPMLKLRLQDAFGITSIRRILDATVIFQLLSPADRPIQTTGDLPGFWSGSYADVRKEMRGRYPKHPWPENPGKIETDR
jgi:ATP-dependent helicase HrpB